jgi:hypothetical protein
MHTNAGSRLYSLLAAAAAQNLDLATHVVWARALGLPEGEASSKVHVVAEQLHLMHQELESIRDTIAAGKLLRADVYTLPFNVIDSVLTPSNLGAPWRAYQPSLRPEVMQMLNVAIDLLPDEESSIDAKDLAALLADIEDLERSVTTASVPSQLRKTIRVQCARMRKAIQSYRVVGARALHDAAVSGVGEILANGEEIRKHKQEPVLSRFGAVVKRMGEMADEAEKAEKLVSYAKNAWDYVNSVWPSLPSP